jgi:hypothetical protein
MIRDDASNYVLSGKIMRHSGTTVMTIKESQNIAKMHDHVLCTIISELCKYDHLEEINHVTSTYVNGLGYDKEGGVVVRGRERMRAP